MPHVFDPKQPLHAMRPSLATERPQPRYKTFRSRQCKNPECENRNADLDTISERTGLCLACTARMTTPLGLPPETEEYWDQIVQSGAAGPDEIEQRIAAATAQRVRQFEEETRHLVKEAD